MQREILSCKHLHLAAMCDTVFAGQFGGIEDNAALSDIAAIAMERLSSRSLAALRDVLSPKLISGEIDVSQIES